MNRRLAYLLIASVAVLALGYLIWVGVSGTSQSGDCDNMASEACRRPAPSSGYSSIRFDPLKNLAGS
jgi:hypothetical protein